MTMQCVVFVPHILGNEGDFVCILVAVDMLNDVDMQRTNMYSCFCTVYSYYNHFVQESHATKTSYSDSIELGKRTW